MKSSEGKRGALDKVRFESLQAPWRVRAAVHPELQSPATHSPSVAIAPRTIQVIGCGNVAIAGAVLSICWATSWLCGVRTRLGLLFGCLSAKPWALGVNCTLPLHLSSMTAADYRPSQSSLWRQRQHERRSCSEDMRLRGCARCGPVATRHIAHDRSLCACTVCGR